MRDGGTGDFWSSAFVVRVLGLVVVILVAGAGFAAAALTSLGGSELPMEHEVEQPTTDAASQAPASGAPVRGAALERGEGQGSA